MTGSSPNPSVTAPHPGSDEHLYPFFTAISRLSSHRSTDPLIALLPCLLNYKEEKSAARGCTAFTSPQSTHHHLVSLTC